MINSSISTEDFQQADSGRCWSALHNPFNTESRAPLSSTPCYKSHISRLSNAISPAFDFGYVGFTFVHLADAFIQGDLQCIQAILFISMCVPWELNPQPFALLTQCSTTEPHPSIHPSIHPCLSVWTIYLFTYHNWECIPPRMENCYYLLILM